MGTSSVDQIHRRKKSQAPPVSSKKPTYQKIGKAALKKIQFHSKSCEDVSTQERIFNKLNPTNSQHVHKMKQRHKAIAKGKNTIGYDIYSRTIPKEKRQKFSMVTPSTPDHTLDIPNKKWNGLVRSWYVVHSFLHLLICFECKTLTPNLYYFILPFYVQ